MAVDNQAITVPAGTTSLPLPVTIYGDWIDEVDDLERFYVELSSPVPGDIYVSPNLSGTVYTQDDDIAGFTVEPASLLINEAKSTTFTVSLDTDPEHLVIFDISQSLGANERLQILTDTVSVRPGHLPALPAGRPAWSGQRNCRSAGTVQGVCEPVHVRGPAV